MKLKRTGILHMKMHKDWMVMCAEKYGVKDVVPNAPDDWTVEDVKRHLDEQAPREYWPECDNEHPDGKCAGCL